MRTPPSPALKSTRIVAVLRAPHARAYEPIVRTLADAGVVCIELTLTTPGTIDRLRRLIAAVPHADIGVGTVVSDDDARAALDAGARFLVSPTVDPNVIAHATRRGVPVYPGAFTPSEVHAAWRSGATAVKIFPASTVGPAYARHLAGPFPEISTMPSGGVALDEIADWLGAGCLAVSLGGPLLGDAFEGGDLGALHGRAVDALAQAATARRPR